MNGIDSDIQVESYTNSHTMLVIAGPKSRELLDSVLYRTSFLQQDFPWLTGKRVFIGHVDALAIAISYSGEQAFELHTEDVATDETPVRKPAARKAPLKKTSKAYG